MTIVCHISEALFIDAKHTIFKLRFSNGKNSIGLSFQKNGKTADEFNACVALIKMLNSNSRNFDAPTRVWTISATLRPNIVNAFKSLGVHVETHSWRKFDEFFGLVKAEAAETLHPDDFFNAPPTASSAPVIRTLDIVRSEFKELTGIELDKTGYRKAALQFHPDKIGSSEIMYKINALWKECQHYASS